MRFEVLLLLPISIAAAQSVGAGVKGGVPFGSVFTATGYIGGEPFRSNKQRFTVGPMLEIRLPMGLGVEFDALYKRFDQSGGSIRAGATVAKTGSSWEFPLLGKYRFGRSFVKPYIETGVSFNHLSGFLLPFRTLPSPPSDQPEGSTTRTGVAVGAGIELKLTRVRLSPGIRYSPWGDKWFVPGSNVVDLLLSVVF